MCNFYIGEEFKAMTSEVNNCCFLGLEKEEKKTFSDNVIILNELISTDMFHNRVTMAYYDLTIE